MSSQNYPIPPVPSSPPASGGVRRHHTITAASRSARGAARESITEEVPDPSSIWNDDEPVDQDWVGGIGAVGEKTSLHRQASLPTRYNRAFQGSRSGTMTPKTVNSLAAIAGHEGDEEPWNTPYDAEEPSPQQPPVEPQSQSSASPHSASTSPPPGANVRRHVSMITTGATRKTTSGLRRSGTVQGTNPGSHAHYQTNTPPETVHADEDEGGAEDQPQYEDYYNQAQQNYPTSPIGRQSPWATGSNSGQNEWRSGAPPSNQNANPAFDDITSALSALEIASNTQSQYYNPYGGGVMTGQSVHPPRFNPTHPPPLQPPGAPRHQQNAGNNNGFKLTAGSDGRRTPLGAGLPRGGSATGAGASYYQNNQRPGQNDDRTQSGAWEGRERALSSRGSNPNLQHGYHSKNASSSSAGSGVGNANNGNENIPNVPPIPAQYLQQQPQRMTNNNQDMTLNAQQLLTTPIDVPTLLATKGYNPQNFDTKPPFARYFVIKSYTEDDVHKSLKYEIWSSTDPGNKRLDKAYKETAGRGPIYLFFSVNASGHFCGMAEMITPVDYTRSSTVWASDKWKGVFKVKWTFVRDIPNATLRHIKLNNTQERKPVTNSRDTQELLPDAGQEMLRIFHTHPSRTSLLQDYAFYELQALQKLQAQGNSGANSPSQSTSPSNVHSPQMQPAVVPGSQQQNAFSMAYQMPAMMMAGYPQANSGMGYGNPTSQAYGTGAMGGYGTTATGQGYGQGGQAYSTTGPGYNVGVGQGGNGYGGQQGYGGQMSQTQAMHQSVMRHSSPGPNQSGFF